MAISKTQAAKLLTAAEMEVFSASRAPAITQLSAARLAGKVKRSRTMRDKQRDLLQRQTLATRGRTGTKGGTSGSANDRTAKKIEILEDILQRFSDRLEKVQAAAAREEARAAAKQGSAKAPAKKKGATKRTPGK